MFAYQYSPVFLVSSLLCSPFTMNSMFTFVRSLNVYVYQSVPCAVSFAICLPGYSVSMFTGRLFQ